MRRMELDRVILRWKKTTRALKIHEQEYGRHLTDVLERVTDAQLVHFTDPVEAAAFFCMLDLVRRTGEEKLRNALPHPVPVDLFSPQQHLCLDRP
ncbi:MAG: hypothetical protein GX651_00495 [Methanomicrobiales archaeon]|nr:hypothetical protein [Methanomicrobiales archaeon]